MPLCGYLSLIAQKNFWLLAAARVLEKFWIQLSPSASFHINFLPKQENQHNGDQR